MELVNDFTVNVPVDEAWVTLTDVERIAPCLPGAQLQEVEGDTYRGIVKVKVGPILAQFKGQASFVERDVEHHKAVLKAEGRDTGGKGNASALITAQLTPQGGASTHVQVTTDLTITGKVAQFGRGAMADVSTKLLGQFVDNLETTVLNQPNGAPAAAGVAAGAATVASAAASAASDASTATTAAPTAPMTTATTTPTTPPSVRKIESKEVEPLDLMDAAGGAMIKRLIPAGIVGLIVLFLIRRLRHR
jgi:uncharacterized protein